MPELVLPVQPQAEVVVNTMNMTTIDPLSMINIDKDLFKILNQWTTREANGQTPIDRNKTIAQTAKDHIRDMLEMSPKYFQFKDEMEYWENWSSQLLIKRLQESEDNTKIDRSTDLEKVRAIAKEAMFDNQKSGNTLTIIGKLRLLMEGQEPKDEINLIKEFIKGIVVVTPDNLFFKDNLGILYNGKKECKTFKELANVLKELQRDGNQMLRDAAQLTTTPSIRPGGKYGGFFKKPKVEEGGGDQERPKHPNNNNNNNNKNKGGKAVPREASKPDVLCNGCGRVGHTKVDCRNKNHKDFNKSDLSWDDSESGKAWDKKGIKTLPFTYDLDGKSVTPMTQTSSSHSSSKRKHEGGPSKANKDRRSKSEEISNSSCNDCIESEQLHIINNISRMTPNSLIESEIISNDLKLSINFLPDTGALQGNYISKEIADWLRQSGGKIIKKWVHL